VTRSAVLIDDLHGPQGIDAFGTSLYIATQGNTADRRGNCVLEIESVEEHVELLLSGTSTTPSTTEITCGFTRIQVQHSWRSLRVHPSGEYAVVSVGADCNWPCEDDIATGDLQTTLVRVDLVGESRGKVSLVAKGIRNAIGLWFDTEHPDRLLFTSFGSDRATGVPGATMFTADNVPDCTVEVLTLGESSQAITAPAANDSQSTDEPALEDTAAAPTAPDSQSAGEPTSGGVTFASTADGYSTIARGTALVLASLLFHNFSWTVM